MSLELWEKKSTRYSIKCLLLQSSMPSHFRDSPTQFDTSRLCDTFIGPYLPEAPGKLVPTHRNPDPEVSGGAQEPANLAASRRSPALHGTDSERGVERTTPGHCDSKGGLLHSHRSVSISSPSCRKWRRSDSD